MALSRQITFLVDPKEGISSTISWPTLAEDGNTDSKAITCGYTPRSRGPSVNVVQEQTIIGGRMLTKAYRTFRSDLSQDDGENIVGDVILNNMDPLLARRGMSENVRFLKAEFPRLNPISNGLTVQFVTNAIDPHKSGTMWKDVDGGTTGDQVGLPSSLGRSVNIRIRDETAIAGVPVYDGLILHYLELRTRQGD